MKQSETSIIKRIRKLVPKYGNDVVVGIGDDAAVLKSREGEHLLITTDAQVEGVHFLRDQVSVVKIGEKAAVAAISDIAAMGGVPKHILVALAIPSAISSSRERSKSRSISSRQARTINVIDELYRGFFGVCKKYDIDIVGGNISRGEQLIINITTLAFAKPDEVVLRSGAKVGDMVLVTGTLGDAPVPRVAEGLIIGKSKLASAMIDVSDGLSTDIGHICDVNGVGVRLFAKAIPTTSSPELALHGGEDYELCFTASPKNAKELINLVKRETGTNVTVIGEILKKSEGRWIVNKDGKKKKLVAKGWDHFRK